MAGALMVAFVLKRSVALVRSKLAVMSTTENAALHPPEHVGFS